MGPKISKIKGGHDDCYGLTRAEMQILGILAMGLNRQEAAEQLNISLNTVKSHLARVYRKMGVHTAAAAVAKCFNEHIIKDGIGHQ